MDPACLSYIFSYLYLLLLPGLLTMNQCKKLINFANKELKTKITCDALSVDGCEVENLIDTEPCNFHQQKYFMSEYYIKCPVEIILTFPCLVDISAVVIEPKVLSHRSKCIEMFTVFQRPLCTNLKRKRTLTAVDEEKNLKHIFPCVYEKDYTDPVVRSNNSFLLNFSCKHKDSIHQDFQPNKIIFVNSKHRVQYDMFSGNSLTHELRPHASVRSCSHLLIKITWATIPVLHKLEIWGIPSTLNNGFIINNLYELLSTFSPKPEASTTKLFINSDKQLDNSDQLLQTGHIQDCSVSERVTDVDVPKEFIDPITFFIMTIPLLLPSGNTIDRSTLDKYIIEEEKYGRLPSDPFTGIVFHDRQQPVPNSSLKSRIDEYLLKNSTMLDLDGFTTGVRAVQKTVDSVVKSLSQRTTKKAKIIENGMTNIMSTKFSTSKKVVLELDNTSTSVSKKSPTIIQEVPTSRREEQSLKLYSHELDLKDSLDLSIRNMLSSLPVRNKSRNVRSKSECCRCNSIDMRSLFKLPCFPHLLQRLFAISS